MAVEENRDVANPFLSIPRPVKTYHTNTYARIAPQNNGFKGNRKTVLITGGAAGIGESISNSFAEAGIARLVIISRSPEPLQKLKARLASEYPELEVVTYSASINDLDRITQILREVEHIDVLVLNAAATHVFSPPTSLTTDQVREVFEHNVLSSFHFIQTYLSLPPPASGSKTLISVNTLAAQTTMPGLSLYGSSKAALAQIVQHFATDQASKPVTERVRMFSFHPGAHYTAAAQSAGVKVEDFPWDDRRLPADFAVWLAGEESGHLHGKFVWAHWDVDELVALKEKAEKDSSFLTIGLTQ